MNINASELLDTVLPNACTTNDDVVNHEAVLSDTRIDYSALGDIDPDTHFLAAYNSAISDYYTEGEFNKIPEYSNQFTIFNVNIRSIPKNFDKLRLYLQELNHNFSVISITESWLKEYNENTYNLNNYTHIRKIRYNRMGGGVSLFIHNSIKFEQRLELIVDLEGVDCLTIEIPKDELNSPKNIILLSLYKPPDINKALFTEKLTDLLEVLHRQNKFVFILGDFNIDVAENMLTTDRYVSDFHNSLLAYFHRALINKPTRVSDRKSTIIDNIYTNISSVAISGILRTDFSDHYSLFCITDLKQNVNTNKEFNRREYNGKNTASFTRHLKALNWDNVLSTGNLNESYTYFQNKMMDIFQKCFPFKTIIPKYNNRHSYLTSGLKQSIKQKHKLYDIYVKHPTEFNKSNYNKHRNKLTSLLRINERKHHQDLLELNKNDMSKSWKIMREVIGKHSNADLNKCVFNVNGSETNNSQIITNEFNDYFVNIGPVLANHFDDSLNPLQYVNSVVNSIYIPIISEAEVTETMFSLKNSSAGWDEIPAHIIKQNISILVKPITHLINCSIQNGMFPDELKLAKVIPIFKAGDKKNISNYRPISVLSVFSKVFERIMYEHLIDFIDQNDILYKYQFGFRKHHSTNHAIITLVEKITNALDNGKIVVGCYLDLKKAFDTVNHHILISKLYKYGIRGHILRWFKSYLQNRQQYVLINGVKSTTKQITCGVPQGSILGPLLFILYINDLSNVSELLFPILFADDTSVFIESDNESTIIQTLNTELDKLNGWLRANKLTINVSKTYYMLFHRGRRKININDPCLNNTLINKVKYIKFLGVIIDENLKWNNHITYIKNKIAKGFGIILRARKFFSRKTLLNLYQSFIFPYLIYCVEIWGNTSDIYLQPLIKLQKKIVRVITFSEYLAHTKELFLHLDILPFTKLVTHRIGMQMFKYHINDIPQALQILFTHNYQFHSYNTRNKHKLRSVHGKHQYMYCNFRFVGIKIWNYITDHLNVNVSLVSFKKSLKKHIQSELFSLN